jgi:hypothetical protein
MDKIDKVKTAVQDSKLETIIRQHRRWTNWVEPRRIRGEGSLILTNRRLLFLHRIEASPSVAASIKKLADAPIETVLDHALTLHKDNFQIPLSSIVQVGICSLVGFPFPYFYLSVFYLEGKKMTPHTAAFQFRNSTQPQIIMDWGWKGAIRRTIKANRVG